VDLGDLDLIALLGMRKRNISEILEFLLDSAAKFIELAFNGINSSICLIKVSINTWLGLRNLNPLLFSAALDSLPNDESLKLLDSCLHMIGHESPLTLLS